MNSQSPRVHLITQYLGNSLCLLRINASATLGGTSVLAYQDDRKIRVGVTNSHVFNPREDPIDTEPIFITRTTKSGA